MNLVMYFIIGCDFIFIGDFVIGFVYILDYLDSGKLDEFRLCMFIVFGVLQVLGLFQSEKVIFIVLIVVYEIGYNFGFLYDGDDNLIVENCSVDEFIMGFFLILGLDEFLICFCNVLKVNINVISRIEDCFDLFFDLIVSE